MTCTCEFGQGFAVCHCAQCCRTFTSIQSFDLHQRWADDGVTCMDPAVMTTRAGAPRMSALRLTPDGELVWGRAQTEAGRARIAAIEAARRRARNPAA